MFNVSGALDRSKLFSRFSRDELVTRYRQKYGLGNTITIEHVQKHAELEGMLTDKLLATTLDTRSETFEAAYSQLYSDLPWLAGTGTHNGGEQWCSLMKKIIHKPDAKVYEIGSGAGYLVKYLGQQGYKCTGTDISSEREKASSSATMEEKNVNWAVTDGVNLTKFAQKDNFDFIISDQVVEHLHPHDIITHFKEAKSLLKSGGCYIMRTPYSAEGPCDLSVVFGEDKPVFMHLHEFGYTEMTVIKQDCGYKNVKAVFRYSRFSICIASSFYFKYIRFIENLAKKLSISSKAEQIFKKMRRFLLLPRGVWVCFET